MILLHACVIAIILAIAAEAVTEIIVEGEIFAPFRRWVKCSTYPLDRPPPDTLVQTARVWFDKLISCGYCTSVWIAGMCATQSAQLFGNILINWVIMVFVIHRLSNLWHVLFKLLQAGRVDTRDYKLEVKHEFHEFGEGSGEGISETESASLGTSGSQDTV